jgi:hypothetical protein
MLTLGGKLLDSAEKRPLTVKKLLRATTTAADPRCSRPPICRRVDELALGADEAGLLGRLLTVEPDLGDRAAVTRRLWHVVLH